MKTEKNNFKSSGYKIAFFIYLFSSLLPVPVQKKRK